MIGRLKFYMQRLLGYASIVQFVMVAYMFIHQAKISLWWIALIIPSGMVVVWIDYRWIAKDEIGEFFKHGESK